jgi:hypothetical protein
MPPSAVVAFFESKAFTDWKKGQDAVVKLQTAVIDRLDGVIRSINVLAKSRRY